MTTLLSALVAEHDHIRRVLAALHDFAAFHAHDDPAARAELGQFVTYLREYVDGVHHHKEEDVLFVAMVGAGLPRDAGPIGCMRHDHDLGRSHVQILAELAGGVGPLTARDQTALGRTVAGYVGLLAAHIGKEDHMLYPMAARLVPAETMATLDAAVAPADAAAHRLTALGDALIARYAAARVAS